MKKCPAPPQQAPPYNGLRPLFFLNSSLCPSPSLWFVSIVFSLPFFSPLARPFLRPRVFFFAYSFLDGSVVLVSFFGGGGAATFITFPDQMLFPYGPNALGERAADWGHIGHGALPVAGGGGPIMVLVRGGGRDPFCFVAGFCHLSARSHSQPPMGREGQASFQIFSTAAGDLPANRLWFCGVDFSASLERFFGGGFFFREEEEISN